MANSNSALSHSLFARYYKGKDQELSGDEVSSHWKLHSDHFAVQVDESGNIADVTEKAMGHWRWGKWTHAAIDLLCGLAHLSHLSHRARIIHLYHKAIPLCRSMGLDPTFDVFRQVCTAAILQRHITADVSARRMHIFVIGDGLGVLSSCLKALYANSTIVLIDIGKTLLFQAHYLQRSHSGRIHALVDEVDESKQYDFVYCPAEDLQKLDRFRFDLAVNIASMQEMTMPMIRTYFDFLRSHSTEQSLFYCCNREDKTLPGGERLEFLKYPWLENDEYLIDDYCPWHRYFMGRYHFNDGPIILGQRVPFINYYDGRVRHRLCKLARV
jgi:hypothetical protein